MLSLVNILKVQVLAFWDTHTIKWWSVCECYVIVFILSSSSNIMLTLHIICPPHCLFRALSDLNKDGKMDQQEFSIAMKLIKLKLQGQQLPMVLPPIMKQPPMFSPLISARFGIYLLIICIWKLNLIPRHSIWESEKDLLV